MNGRWADAMVVSLAGVVILSLAAQAVEQSRRTSCRLGCSSATASLHAVLNANEVFRLTDADRDGVENYWSGDVAALLWLDDGSGEPVRLIQDRSLALADLAPVPAGVWEGVRILGPSPGEARAARSACWFVALRDARRTLRGREFAYAAVPAAPGADEWMFVVNSDGVILRQEWPGDAIGVGDVAGVDRIIPRYPQVPECRAWIPTP